MVSEQEMIVEVIQTDVNLKAKNKNDVWHGYFRLTKKKIKEFEKAESNLKTTKLGNRCAKREYVFLAQINFLKC